MSVGSLHAGRFRWPQVAGARDAHGHAPQVAQDAPHHGLCRAFLHPVEMSGGLLLVLGLRVARDVFGWDNGTVSYFLHAICASRYRYWICLQEGAVLDAHWRVLTATPRSHSQRPAPREDPQPPHRVLALPEGQERAPALPFVVLDGMHC